MPRNEFEDRRISLIAPDGMDVTLLNDGMASEDEFAFPEVCMREDNGRFRSLSADQTISYFHEHRERVPSGYYQTELSDNNRD